MEIVPVFGAQLPKTAGVYVELLYCYLNFSWPAWKCWIETISGLRQRVLADNSVYAVRTLGETHITPLTPEVVSLWQVPVRCS